MEANHEVMTPAERATAGLCPECARELGGIDVIGHRDHHYEIARAKRVLDGDAKVRYDMLTAYAKEHPLPDSSDDKPATRGPRR